MVSITQRIHRYLHITLSCKMPLTICVNGGQERKVAAGNLCWSHKEAVCRWVASYCYHAVQLWPIHESSTNPWLPFFLKLSGLGSLTNGNKSHTLLILKASQIIRASWKLTKSFRFALIILVIVLDGASSVDLNAKVSLWKHPLDNWFKKPLLEFSAQHHSVTNATQDKSYNTGILLIQQKVF